MLPHCHSCGHQQDLCRLVVWEATGLLYGTPTWCSERQSLATSPAPEAVTSGANFHPTTPMITLLITILVAALVLVIIHFVLAMFLSGRILQIIDIILGLILLLIVLQKFGYNF